LIVADASVVLAFIIHDESEAYADAAVTFLSRSTAAVPGNFHSEVCNALLRAERLRRIDESRASAALTKILALPLTVELPDPYAAIKLARQHRISCYDAFYLALAVESGRPLATVDAALRRAAEQMKLFWMPA
jgi:predicted nucleic acid-binding protein